MPLDTEESKPRQGSEEEASADQENSKEKSCPSIGESFAPSTSQESGGGANDELRNRQAAVAHVLEPEHEYEKQENSSSSSNRLVVRVDSDISHDLDQTNEDLKKEKSPGDVHHSDDESSKEGGESKQKDALLASMEQGQLHSAGPEDEDEESVPPPPELELQRNVDAAGAPGAFSVVPQEQHRFRDILFRRRQNTGVENTGVESIASATPLGGVTGPQAANVEPLLVSATLVPSAPAEVASTVLPSSTTNEYDIGAASSSEACVVYAEGMSCWTFVKRNRKAQCGIGVALLLFFVLITAFTLAMAWEVNDDDDKIVKQKPQGDTFTSEDFDSASLSPSMSPASVSPTLSPTLQEESVSPSSLSNDGASGDTDHGDWDNDRL
jgi:hypothetical protein